MELIQKAHPSGVSAIAASALHVLVVDDVLMNRDIANAFLRATGHKVTCVESGAEAIAAIKTTDFDVVLMDVRMPEMDGLEATRRIRAFAGARGRVPIVALTARAFTEQVAECSAAGMDGHVAKPFTPETLLTAVLRAVGITPLRGKNVISSPAALVPENRGDIPTCLSGNSGTISGRPGANVQLEAAYWRGMERICTITGRTFDAVITAARKRYPHYTADIAARVAVATWFYERSDLVSLPVIGLDRLVLDQTVFERTAYFLQPETIDTYVWAIAERAEALLSGMRLPVTSRCTDNQLAEEANAIAGSAGLFGFDRLTYLGCCFGRAVESGSADSPALADGLRAALQDTLSVIHDRKLAMAEI